MESKYVDQERSTCKMVIVSSAGRAPGYLKYWRGNSTWQASCRYWLCLPGQVQLRLYYPYAEATPLWESGQPMLVSFGQNMENQSGFYRGWSQPRHFYWPEKRLVKTLAQRSGQQRKSTTIYVSLYYARVGTTLLYQWTWGYQGFVCKEQIVDKVLNCQS